MLFDFGKGKRGPGCEASHGHAHAHAHADMEPGVEAKSTMRSRVEIPPNLRGGWGEHTLHKAACLIFFYISFEKKPQSTVIPIVNVYSDHRVKI